MQRNPCRSRCVRRNRVLNPCRLSNTTPTYSPRCRWTSTSASKSPLLEPNLRMLAPKRGHLKKLPKLDLQGLQALSKACSGDPQHWSAAKRHHCCSTQHLGCPTTTTAPKRDCATVCSVKGQLHSCGKRVAYVATTAFAHQAKACAKALRHVRQECEVCSGCDLEEAQCKAGGRL